VRRARNRAGNDGISFWQAGVHYFPCPITSESIIQSKALINILDRKGIVSKAELLEEMKKVQAAMIKSEA